VLDAVSAAAPVKPQAEVTKVKKRVPAAACALVSRVVKTRRLPKRGFKNINRKEYAVVSLDALNRFEEGTVVTPELLKETGVISALRDGVKVLANGELNVKLTVKAHKFSAAAAEKIAQVGGTTEVI
jgi:ribosomal protein L15